MGLTFNKPPWLWLALILLAESLFGWLLGVYYQADWYLWHLVVSILLALIWTVFLVSVRLLAGAVFLTIGWALAGDWLIALIWAMTIVLVLATFRAVAVMKSADFSKNQAVWFLIVFALTGFSLGWTIGTVFLFDFSKWLLNKPLL